MGISDKNTPYNTGTSPFHEGYKKRGIVNSIINSGGKPGDIGYVDRYAENTYSPGYYTGQTSYSPFNYGGKGNVDPPLVGSGHRYGKMFQNTQEYASEYYGEEDYQDVMDINQMRLGSMSLYGDHKTHYNGGWREQSQHPADKKEEPSWDALDISRSSIKNISKTLFTFKFLRVLNLNENDLSMIPKEIGELKELRVLDISNNKIKAIPKEMGKLINLESLSLSGNLINTLPFELGFLYKLKSLKLENNPLDESLLSVVDGEKDAVKLIKYLRDKCPPLEPPERVWMPIDQDTPFEDSFTVFNHNILAKTFAPPERYNYAPSWALDWKYRSERIVDDIRKYNPDIICLQELEFSEYTNFFVQKLKGIYKGEFAIRSKTRKMKGYNKVEEYVEKELCVGDDMSDIGSVDGCSIFYRKCKFELKEKKNIEFQVVGSSNEVFEKSKDVDSRLCARDNVAIMCLLEAKDTKNQIFVANVHIYWNPKFEDVKMAQIIILMKKIEEFHARYPLASLVLCGDFNSTPCSAMYDYISRGQLAPNHPVFTGLVYKPSSAIGSSHTLILKDSYNSNCKVPNSDVKYTSSGTYTTYTPEFSDTIDYIWYGYKYDEKLNRNHSSSPKLLLSGLLSLVHKQYLDRLIGLPSAHLPSDHISLMAEFKIPLRKPVDKTPKFNKKSSD